MDSGNERAGLAFVAHSSGERPKAGRLRAVLKTAGVAVAISATYFGVIAILMAPAFDVA